MTPEKENELFATLAGIVAMLKMHGEMIRDNGQMLQQLNERVSRIEGILANAPQTAEFYELRGRVEEISRRLPTTLAYAPPRAS